MLFGGWVAAPSKGGAGEANESEGGEAQFWRRNDIGILGPSSFCFIPTQLGQTIDQFAL